MTDDVVAELDAELALIEELPYRVPLHLLAKRARDEIVGLRGLLEHSDRTIITAVVVATPAIRAEALEEAARLCDRIGLDGFASDGAAAIRALKNKAEPQS